MKYVKISLKPTWQQQAVQRLPPFISVFMHIFIFMDFSNDLLLIFSPILLHICCLEQFLRLVQLDIPFFSIHFQSFCGPFFVFYWLRPRECITFIDAATATAANSSGCRWDYWNSPYAHLHTHEQQQEKKNNSKRPSITTIQMRKRSETTDWAREKINYCKTYKWKFHLRFVQIFRFCSFPHFVAFILRSNGKPKSDEREQNRKLERGRSKKLLKKKSFFFAVKQLPISVCLLINFCWIFFGFDDLLAHSTIQNDFDFSYNLVSYFLIINFFPAFFPFARQISAEYWGRFNGSHDECLLFLVLSEQISTKIITKRSKKEIFLIEQKNWIQLTGVFD